VNDWIAEHIDELAWGAVGLILVALALGTAFRRRLAWSALRSLEMHFLRSLLATLGVLIGVGSVVACMSILEGMSSKVLANLKSLGSNIIYVAPAMARVSGQPVGIAQSLTIESMQRIERDLGDVVSVIAPQATGPSPVRHFEKSESNVTIVATSGAYFEINAYKAERGRVLSHIESNDELALVAVLGAKIAEKLFGGTDPIGDSVKIGNTAYRVVGVLEKRGNVGFDNADDAVYIPIKSGLKRFFNRQWLNWLTVQVRPDSDLEDLQQKVRSVLRRAHNIRPGQPEDFKIYTQEEVRRNFTEFAMIFKIVFYSIAGISLVVGGIGIMNIMLVSVTERTREIGVRMAVGARRGDILLQFLVEALIISLLGGAFGLLLGIMFADLLDKVLQGMMATAITRDVVIAALATTTFVGVVSGLYPAYKASRLDPVEALRYE
jgi:putative ABC transport system permease protein